MPRRDPTPPRDVADLPARGRSAAAAVAGARTAVAGSPQLRALSLLLTASRRLTVAAVAFVLAEAILPNLVIVAMGRTTGLIPDAVTDGLGSAAGTRLLVSLAVAGAIYALSLLRGPVEDALTAAVGARVTVVLQRRVVEAVTAPAGIAHLEDPVMLDRLATASGELGFDLPADAPMTSMSLFGDRLAGALSCLVLATFRWWAGLLLFLVWLAVRRPARAFVVSRVSTFRRATPTLRMAGYLLRLAGGADAAKEVRVFGIGGWLLDRHRDAWLEAMAPSWRELGAIERRIVRIGLVVLVVYLLCAGALGLAAYHGEIGLRTLATMLPMLPMSMSLGSITAADVRLAAMLSALPDVEALSEGLAPRELLGESVAGAAPPAGATPPGGAAPPGGVPAAGLPAAGLPAAEMRFERVGFRYPGAERDVLADLDLTLPAGSSLAVVGVNGAGKTTLVTLLARLRDPTRGRVLVDGIDLARLRAREWQRQVAVVFQEFTRLPLSARENVTMGLLGEPVDEAALARAAERADAAQLVRELPHGWETILSPRYERGADLSGGQWQRLALARALYAVERGARVLVLDEPTAQLDVRREAAFYDRFLEITGGTTSVVISHRFSTVRRADRIAVLDGGRIAELGSHAELLAAGGMYARMFALQAEWFREAGRRGGSRPAERSGERGR